MRAARAARTALADAELPGRGHLVRAYRRRSAIEALFRDGQSSGWPWEASQVRRPDHGAVLLLVRRAWAMQVTLCVGAEAA